MAEFSPPPTRADVRRAGEVLRADERDPYREWAVFLSRWWRSSHAMPLNAFSTTLRGRARRVQKQAIVAQRLKRFDAIEAKLRRFSSLNLDKMQDLGGCRAVLPSLESVRVLTEQYLLGKRLRQRLRGEGRNYIDNPKPDGYRSQHLVYEYVPQGAVQEHWRGLLIEVQIRTALQHAWAAAVETVDLFAGHGIKTGQASGTSWSRFFSLASAAMAMMEGTAPVPGTPSDASVLAREFRELERGLGVFDKLKSWRDVREHIVGSYTSGYVLVETNPADLSVSVKPVRVSKGKMGLYGTSEEGLSGGKQVVLVKVSSAASLRAAYPSWFADTGQFVEAMTTVVRW